MERTVRSRHSRSLSRCIRSTPYPLCPRREITNEGSPKRISSSLALEKRDWEDATCSVCMEFPHNAVLLLCSSHDKGCRPYMCGTSYRYSNCLDQFKKAYTKIHEGAPETPEHPNHNPSTEKSEVFELASCPLCRGQVKGWTVVEPAREYLNTKKRSCMQDNCSFMGTYKELQKHVRSVHPRAKPREVDPTMEQKWRRLEHEREREDVLSTIRSSMPRSVVFGDYVIEMANSDLEDSDEDGEIMGGNVRRGMSRNILYFFLREGARLMRLQQDPHGGGVVAERVTEDVDPSISIAYSSGGDDEYRSVGEGRGLRTERRRRRRRRSRGRLVVDTSQLDRS